MSQNYIFCLSDKFSHIYNVLLMECWTKKQNKTENQKIETSN